MQRLCMVYLDKAFASNSIGFLEVETTSFTGKASVLLLCSLFRFFNQFAIALAIAVHASQYAPLRSFVSLVVF